VITLYHTKIQHVVSTHTHTLTIIRLHMAHIFHLLTRQFTILTILTFKIKLVFWNIEDLLLFISFFIVFHILIFFTFAHVKNLK
jgi:hypothetical protein